MLNCSTKYLFCYKKMTYNVTQGVPGLCEMLCARLYSYHGSSTLVQMISGIKACHTLYMQGNLCVCLEFNSLIRADDRLFSSFTVNLNYVEGKNTQ